MKAHQPPKHYRLEHPVALGSFLSWVRTSVQGGCVVPRYLPKYLFVCLCTLLTSPLRGWEWMRFDARKRATVVHHSPVFIIGHWRSGTTHLHNLLVQDERFCFMSTFQAMAPGFCLSGDRLLKPALESIARRRYPTRLIDNIPLAFDAPQEDEFAMACLTHRAFIHTFSFPKHAERFFDQFVMLDQQTQVAREHWMSTYCRLLRMIQFRGGARRMVLKNCAHTGRIRTLLAQFPNARFIHIHRNPYEVFLSSMHMHRTVLKTSQLQHTDAQAIRRRVLQFYERLMKHLIDVRPELSANQFIDVAFEDLERDPLAQIERIYRQLELGKLQAVRPRIEQYLSTIAGYRKNAYVLDQETIETVNQHWGFALDSLGYDRIESIS